MAPEQASRATGGTGFILVLLGSTVLMGSSFIAGKILLQAGVPPMLLVGWRFFVAALATLPLVLLDHRNPWRALRPPSMSLRDGAVVVVIGLLQTAGVMGLLFLAMQTISASTAAILLFTNPILVALLGRLFLGETLHRMRVLGLIVGAAGVALAIGVGPQLFVGTGTLVGEIIGLLSALCWALATIVTKRSNVPMGAWALSFWQMLVGSLAVLAYACATGERWPAVFTPAQWAWFFWLAIPASTGSFGLWYVALARGGATRTSGYLFLAPLFTVILAYFILGASLSWIQACGGLLVGVALWLVNRETPARTPRELLQEARAEGQP
jgi:drug/metabolite transporter (DMT)-like permease